MLNLIAVVNKIFLMLSSRLPLKIQNEAWNTDQATVSANHAGHQKFFRLSVNTYTCFNLCLARRVSQIQSNNPERNNKVEITSAWVG